MPTIAELGFKIDSSPVVTAEKRLKSFREEGIKAPKWMRQMSVQTTAQIKNLGEMSAQARKTSTSLKRLGNTSLGKIATQSKSANNHLRAVATSAKRVNTNLGKIATQSKSVNNHLRAVATSAKRVNTSLGKIRKEPIDDISKSAKKASFDVGKLSSSMENAGVKSIKLGKKLAKTTAVIAAQAVAIIYFARKWENATVNIAKQLPDGVGKNAYKEVLVDIQDLAVKSGQTRESLAELVAESGKAGVEFKNWSAFMKLGAEGAVALDFEAGKLGQTLLAIGAGFGIRNNIPALEELTKQVNVLADNSKSTAEEIFRTTSRIAGLAHQAGLSEIQLAAMSAALIDTGKSPEIASTAIRSLITNLSSLKNLTPKATEAIKELGLSPENLIENFKTNAPLALSEFKKAVDSSGDVVGNLTRIFGRENSSSIAALLGNMGKYNELLEKAGDKSLVAAKWTDELSRQQATFDTKLGQVRESLKRLITVETLDVFKNLLDSVKPLINDFGVWAKENPRLIKTIALVVGGLALLSPALIGAGALIGGLAVTIGLASKAMGALNLVMRANPIGLVVTALGGLVFLINKLAVEEEKTRTHIKLTSGVLISQETALSNVAKMSSEYILATKERRAEIKEEVGDLIINARAHVDNAKVQIEAAYSTQKAFERIKSNTFNPKAWVIATIGAKLYRNETQILSSEISKSSVTLKRLESQYNNLGKTATVTATNIYGLRDAVKPSGSGGIIPPETFNGINNAGSAFDKLNKSLQNSINMQTLSRLERVKLTDAYSKSTAVEKLVLEGQAKKLDSLSKIKSATRAQSKVQKDLSKDSNKYSETLAKEHAAIDKSILLHGKNEIATYKLGLEQKKIRARDIKGLVVKKKIELANKASLILNKKNNDIIKASKISHDAFFKAEAKAKKERKLGFKLIKDLTQAESKAYDLRQKQIRLEDDYIDVKKELNEKLQFQIILNNQGEDAARKHTLAIKHGSKARAGAVFSLEEQLKAEENITRSTDEMREAILRMTTDGVQGFNDLIRAFGSSVSTSGFNGAISNLGKSIGGLFSSDPAKGGGFGNVFPTGLSTIQNFQLSENGNHGKEYGSAAGKIIGSYWGPIGSALGKIVGGFIGGLFADDPRASIGTASHAAERVGAGGSRDGFYHNRFAKGQDFARDTDFGKIGLISGDTKNVRGEATAAAFQHLDAMKSLYDTTASFLDQDTIDRARDNLDSQKFESLNLNDGIKAQFKVIVNSMSSELSGLYDLSGTLEELTQRTNQIAITAKNGVPYFDAMNLKMGDTNDAVLANTVRFADLAGGLNNLLSASSHYYDIILTDQEKLDLISVKNTASIKKYNKELGLEGNARIGTLAGLKLYTAGLDLSTEAGREAALKSYEIVDAYAEQQAQFDTMKDKLIELNTAFSGLGSPLSSININSISARESLVGLAGGLDGLLGLTNNYVSKLFTDQEQLLISQGQAAQGIAKIAADMGLAANDLDTGSELRAQIEHLNKSGKVQTELGQRQLVALLKQVDNVALLDDAGISATQALSNLTPEIENIIGGVDTLQESSDLSRESIDKLSGSLGVFESATNDAAEQVSLLEQLVETSKNQASEIAKLREESRVAETRRLEKEADAQYLAEKEVRNAA